jgi:uncharacterized protein with GYD domain
MPKYLWQVSYTLAGAKGLKQDGGSARRAAVQAMLEQAGGRLESFYFALGESDLFIVADVPDLTAATAISLTVNATGASQLRTIPLITPEEMDAAARTSIDYRPPSAAGK